MKLTVSTFLPIRIVVESQFEHAVAKLRVGEGIVLARDDRDGAARIAALTHEHEMIGWLPSTDPIVPKLIGGSGYRAQVGKIIRGRYGSRFEAIILQVTMPAGTLDVPAARVRKARLPMTDDMIIRDAAEALSRVLNKKLAEAAAETISLSRDEAVLALGIVDGVTEILAREPAKP